MPPFSHDALFFFLSLSFVVVTVRRSYLISTVLCTSIAHPIGTPFYDFWRILKDVKCAPFLVQK